MKILSRLIAAILFVFFFFFALRNTQEVTMHFFLGYERTDPLVLVLLAFFVIGAVLGVLAMAPLVLRHRREASRYKKALSQVQKQQEEIAQVQAQPPQEGQVPLVAEVAPRHRFGARLWLCLPSIRRRPGRRRSLHQRAKDPDSMCLCPGHICLRHRIHH